MKFTNKLDAARTETWGVVESGADVEVTAEQAVGLVLQCGPDGRWAPADDEAKAAVEAAVNPPAEAAAEAKPKTRASKDKE